MEYLVFTWYAENFQLCCSFHLFLDINPPLQVLVSNGALLGDGETQLDLEGPLEYDALLRIYYGFVTGGGNTVLSSHTTDANGEVEVRPWYSK